MPKRLILPLALISAGGLFAQERNQWVMAYGGVLQESGKAELKNSVGFGAGYGVWVSNRFGVELSALSASLVPKAGGTSSQETSGFLSGLVNLNPGGQTWYPFLRAGLGATQVGAPLSGVQGSTTRSNLIIGIGAQAHWSEHLVGSLEVRTVSISTQVPRNEVQGLLGFGYRWGGAKPTPKSAPAPAPVNAAAPSPSPKPPAPPPPAPSPIPPVAAAAAPVSAPTPPPPPPAPPAPALAPVPSTPPAAIAAPVSAAASTTPIPPSPPAPAPTSVPAPTVVVPAAAPTPVQPVPSALPPVAAAVAPPVAVPAVEPQPKVAPSIPTHVVERPIPKSIHAPMVHFANNQARLSPEGLNALNAFAGELKMNQGGYEVFVFGYASAIGPKSFNQRLSERRASATAKALMAAGIPGSSIQASGQGSSNPIGDNATLLGRAKNRRAEVTVKSHGAELQVEVLDTPLQLHRGQPKP